MPFLPSTLPIVPERPGRAGFLLIYAIASAGGVVGYLPLLTVLLPIKIERMTGNARLDLLTITAIVGALAASLANIAFGWWSDRRVARGKGRRGLIALGIAALAGSFAAIAAAASPAAVVVAIVLFQIAMNLLLAPLGAIMADEIPASRKGVAGGLLALGNPLAAGVSAILVVAFAGEAARLAAVAALVAGCVLPLLFTHGAADPIPPTPQIGAASSRRDLVLAWSARLLMQIGGTVLSLYLIYYLESIAPGLPPRRVATLAGQILTIVYIVPLPIAVALGRASDLAERRKPFLFAAAAVAAGGLLVMAFARDWSAGAAGFAIYSVGSAVFLVLNAAFVTQLLPDPAHRGRDLGLFNLANTLPSLIGPLLAWLLATPSDFAMLMLPLAGLTLAGGVAILFAREPGYRARQ